jgi:hypothetical protein
MTHDPIDPDLIPSLSRPSAYPLDGSASEGVELVQTHLSWVFLTRDRVYKLRKDVDLGFVRFLSRAERDADCAREVRLNRRLAPDVYLGIAPLRREAGGIRVGPLLEEPDLSSEAEKAVEMCVVMRRLPAGRDALSLLGGRKLRAVQVDRMAELVARFHEAGRLGRSGETPEELISRSIEPALDNFRALEPFAGTVVRSSTLRTARERARAFLEAHRGRLERRARAGRFVDGHGDLHLAHVWFEREDAEPLVIDCVEFNEGLRRIDAACDVAFLAMDLRYRDRPRLAERFLRGYAREADDFDLYGVIDYFVSYRAAVRAKVAAIGAADERIGRPQRRAAAESARRHLSLASRALAPQRRAALVVMCGIVGTGKTSVAEVAADLGGAVISSDRVRKRLAGLPPHARVGAERGLYTRERTDETYAGLLERAAPVVESGRVAILDATFAEASRRSRAREWAERRGVPAYLVEARCGEKVALARLARRKARGRDPSDAGPELYRQSASRFEPPEEWPRGRRIVVRTDAPSWRAAVRGELRARLAGER